MLAVVFVDALGECVDCCTSIAPFDAKVAGAHMLVVSSDVVERLLSLGFGHTRELQIVGDARDIVVRRIGDGYHLVVLVRPGGITADLLRGIDAAVREIREEAAIPVPSWEPRARRLEVDVRDAVGWAYAPSAFRHEGRLTEVADVLGRWTEGRDCARVCFRVRTRDGRELTLAHDTRVAEWTLLTDVALDHSG